MQIPRDERWILAVAQVDATRDAAPERARTERDREQGDDEATAAEPDGQEAALEGDGARDEGA